MTTNDGTDIKTDAQTVRVAIYARESADAQVNGQKAEAGLLDSQVAGRVPWYNVEDVYTNQGQSALPEEEARRPEYRLLTDDAQAGKFDLLVTTSMDRRARDLDAMLEITRQLKDYEVEYMTIHEDMGITGPKGEEVLTQLRAFAQRPLPPMLSAHTKRGLNEQA